MPPRKSKSSKQEKPQKKKAAGYIAGAGLINNEKITDTLENNYMPYAMSVIVSRAIPEIDGFKPSHRKLLYTMYRMGLLGGKYVKSANIVGETMKLNPHGDAAIYETMVRLTRGNESLLHPYIDSKGAFGSAFSSRDTPAAARYTEARLDELCRVVFGDIEKDTVDFVDNYDSTLKEPVLLPVAFPSILVNNNTGIAVGMASNICSFNLREICQTTISLINNPYHKIRSTLIAPDFPGGGQLIYDEDEISRIYETGRGSFKVRGKYSYDSKNNCIDITEIPPTTTIEAIIDKTVDCVKSGKAREISDIRDETGIDGLKITIDLKRGADPDKVMQKLYRFTTLEDSFSCNFNVLIGGSPKVCSVRELLEEWTAFRTECIRRRAYFDMTKAKNRLHLLEGLQKILLDIDKAIRIIRNTAEEKDVVPNLMRGFSIDEAQAEYVAEIKLRHLNREYIIKQTADIERLRGEIIDLQSILESKYRVQSIICRELTDIADKYGKDRKSAVIRDVEQYEPEDETPDNPVNLFLTKEGYFKRITPQSLRMSFEHKLKEGDEISQHIESTTAADLLFFTDKCMVYKAKVSQFGDSKATLIGDYIPAQLGMDDDEKVIFMSATKDYKGQLLFCFENGKVCKTDISQYETKTNRKKLTGAYSDKCGNCVAVIELKDDCDIMLCTSAQRWLIFNSKAVAVKSKGSQGMQVVTLRKNQTLEKAKIYEEGSVKNPNFYKTKNLPAAAKMPKQEDIGEQLELM
ncbi:MAG: topoisomerase IV [Clostridia bacterium]|nr:topoisomerase IV [Clostridia bacterium]